MAVDSAIFLAEALVDDLQSRRVVPACYPVATGVVVVAATSPSMTSPRTAGSPRRVSVVNASSITGSAASSTVRSNKPPGRVARCRFASTSGQSSGGTFPSHRWSRGRRTRPHTAVPGDGPGQGQPRCRVPGRGHHREVPALSRRRIQDLGGRLAGAQRPRHPILLRLVGVAVVVARGRILVIAGEDRARRWSSQVCRSMVPPSVVTVASRYRASPSRNMPSGAGVSSQSAVCAWVEGMRGASRSSRRRGQILSGWVPDIGSCSLSRAGIAVGSTITVGQRAVCFPDGQFFLPLRAHTPAGGRSARPMRRPACY